MKATGIVRRIDDLGRVVIPKEIRRTMHLKEGASLEIYTDKDGEVIFKKYSPVGEMSEDAQIYCDAVHKATGITAAITDRDSVVAAAGEYKRELCGKKISRELESVLGGRTPYLYRIGSPRIGIIAAAERDADLYAGTVCPINVDGDIIGSVVLLIDDRGAEHGKTEEKLVAMTAHLLARLMES